MWRITTSETSEFLRGKPWATKVEEILTQIHGDFLDIFVIQDELFIIVDFFDCWEGISG